MLCIFFSFILNAPLNLPDVNKSEEGKHLILCVHIETRTRYSLRCKSKGLLKENTCINRRVVKHLIIQFAFHMNYL